MKANAVLDMYDAIDIAKNNIDEKELEKINAPGRK